MRSLMIFLAICPLLTLCKSRSSYNFPEPALHSCSTQDSEDRTARRSISELQLRSDHSQRRHLAPRTLSRRSESTKEFGKQEAYAILQAKRDIIIATNEDDILVFLGNTASYFYHSFGPTDEREVHLLPISGSYFTPGDWHTIPTSEDLKGFLRYVLRPAIPEDCSRRIVLIAHSPDGHAVDGFMPILTKAIRNPDVVFINLTNRWQIESGQIKLPSQVTTIKQLILRNHNPGLLVDLASNRYTRLTVRHQHWKWASDPSEAQKHLEADDNVKRVIDVIKNTREL